MPQSLPLYLQQLVVSKQQQALQLPARHMPKWAHSKRKQAMVLNTSGCSNINAAERIISSICANWHVTEHMEERRCNAYTTGWLTSCNAKSIRAPGCVNYCNVSLVRLPCYSPCLC
jgi:hypothetical protein